MTATARMEQSRAATKGSVTRELLLVSILSRIWPAHLHPPRVPQANFPYVVCLHAPGGAMVWRITEEELPLFAHLAMNKSDTDNYKASDKEALLLLLATEGWS